MKIYTITYVHSCEAGVFIRSKTTINADFAHSWYEDEKAVALDMARDYDPDSDEEDFRDVVISANESSYQVHVPADNEHYAVQYLVSEI